MKIILKIILCGVTMFSTVSVMAIGIMFLKSIGVGLENSFRFWFVTLTTVIGATSLIIHSLEIIGYEKANKRKD